MLKLFGIGLVIATTGMCGTEHAVGVQDAGTDAGPWGDPNVMFVVDRSASMNKPVDPTLPACATGNPACPVCGLACSTLCPATCPTRLGSLQSAMHSFLTTPCSVWRVGLLPFPTGNLCGPGTPADIRVDLPAPGVAVSAGQLAAQEAAVDTAVQGLVAGGGTPTGLTLASLASHAPLLDPARNNFLVLLTDGEPNCNLTNPNDCTSTDCNCTLFSGMGPVSGACPGPSCTCGSSTASTTCTDGCLDTDATATALQGLLAQGVRTLVVGFGSETQAGGTGTGYAPAALNAMAVAGGMPRPCPTGTECGTGDACDATTHRCARAYYQANDGAALLSTLNEACTAVVTAAHR